MEAKYGAGGTLLEHVYVAIQFMMHSSGVMPSGSPYFPSIESVEKLYRDLNELFSQVAKHFCGSTLIELHDRALL